MAREILVRSHVVVAGHYAVNQLGEALGERGIVELELCERLCAPVGDEDVALADQLDKGLVALGVLRVEGDALLVGVFEVEGDVFEGAVGDAVRRGAPAKVVATERLDLDDLCAPICEEARCARSGYEGSELDDLDARKRPFLIRLSTVLSRCRPIIRAFDEDLSRVTRLL